MKTPTRKLIKQADKLFAELIHKRGKCERCGKITSLQTAHIIPRTNKNLRWNPDNALLLCVACHLYWFHKNPLEAMEWFKLYFPIQYAYLMREKNKLNTSVGKTIEFTITELKEKLKGGEKS